MLAVHRAAEPLVGVIVGVAHLHVVNGRSGSHGSESQTIDLLVFLERIASELNAHILQVARVVVGISASVLGAWTSLDLLVEHAVVVRSLAAEDDAAPVTGLTATGSHLRGEDDRACLCAFGDELATWLGDEGSLGVLVALDDGARLDGQFSTVSDVHPSFEQVGAFLNSLLALEDEVLVAVADDDTVGIVLAVVVEENVVAGLEATVGGPVVDDRRSAVVAAVVAGAIVVVVTAARCHRGSEGQDAHAS